MFKYKYQTKEEIPADQVSFYEEKEVEVAGKKAKWWVLKIEGATDSDRFKEFRTNNQTLHSDNKRLLERYEGFEDDEVLARAKALLDICKDIQIEDAEKVLKKGGVEAMVEARTKAMKAEYEKKLQKASTESERLHSRLTEVEINQAVITEAVGKGLKPTATTDITARARSIFRLHEGKPVAFEQDGKTIRIGKDGITPLTIQEWVEYQVTEAAHLFEPNAGGGAPGNGSGGTGGKAIANPWKRETRNLTEQMRITKQDPKLAARLKQQAGVNTE